MAVEVPPPDWVSYDANKTQGLDLLGLRAPVQAIGNELLNGLTTVTPKVRYLSLLTWVVWRYSQSRLPDSAEAFTEFATAQEAAIVMANAMRAEQILNLVGVTQARVRLEQDGNRLSLMPLIGANAFDIYANAGRQLGLTYLTKSGVPGLTKERGLLLARAFEAAVANTAYFSHLSRRSKRDTASRTELEELSKYVSLDRPTSQERALLVGAILPNERGDIAETNRLQCFTLLLWLADKMGRQVTEADVFKVARKVPAGLPEAIRSSVDGWLDYHIRDALAFSHELVLNLVLREVDAATARRKSPALAAEVVAIIIDDFDDHNSALRQIGLLKPHESIHQMRFGVIYERLIEICSTRSTFENGLRRWDSELSEFQLYTTAQNFGSGAAAILPIVWCLAMLRTADHTTQSLNQTRSVRLIGGFYQIGIDTVIVPKVAEFVREDKYFTEVMRELLFRTVQQHLRVAWSRLGGPQGNDVAVLTADLDTWARRAVFSAGRTDSRFVIAIAWLKQLHLTDDSGVTASGARVLQNSLGVLGAAAR